MLMYVLLFPSDSQPEEEEEGSYGDEDDDVLPLTQASHLDLHLSQGNQTAVPLIGITDTGMA